MFTINEQKLLNRLHTELPQAFRRGFVAGLMFGLAVGCVLILVSGR
jgi:hypothetical protein